MRLNNRLIQRFEGALLAGMMLLASLPPTAPIAAQESGDTLTLDEAMRIATGGNPAYLRSVIDLGLNGPESQNNWLSNVLPRVSLTLFNTGYDIRRSATGLNDFGDRTTREARIRRDSDTNQSIGLTWSIQGNSIVNSLRRQNRVNSDRGLQEQSARWTLRNDVWGGYFSALREQELLEVERSLLADREVDLEVTEALFGIVQRSRADVLNAEFAIEQQRQNILRQERQHELVLLALRTTLGDPDLEAFQVAEIELPIFDPSALDLEGLVAEALAFNPGVQQSESAFVMSELSLSEAHTMWWPQLDVRFSAGRSAFGEETDALADFSYDEPLTGSLSFSVSLPGFSNFSDSRLEVTRARIGVHTQREALRETRLSTEETVRSAFLQLRNQFENLQLQQRSLELARQILELAREEYRLGARTFEQLQDGIRQEADARRQVITAQYDFVDAVVTLESAIGSPLNIAELSTGAGN